MKFKAGNKEIELREICFEDIENYFQDINSLGDNLNVLKVQNINISYISKLSNDTITIQEIKKLPSSELKELLYYLESELNLKDTKKKFNPI